MTRSRNVIELPVSKRWTKYLKHKEACWECYEAKHVIDLCRYGMLLFQEWKETTATSVGPLEAQVLRERHEGNK